MLCVLVKNLLVYILLQALLLLLLFFLFLFIWHISDSVFEWSSINREKENFYNNNNQPKEEEIFVFLFFNRALFSFRTNQFSFICSFEFLVFWFFIRQKNFDIIGEHNTHTHKWNTKPKLLERFSKLVLM